MEQQSALFDPSEPAEAFILGAYAERTYLGYVISVVKDRTLSEAADSQKPVQRRILFAMHEMGLRSDAKPVKSVRMVGDVLGRFHPHSDQPAYDALVRLAQGFLLCYPLIDGQGNFGSRDGDGAAVICYTEAQLMPISRLLLEELDQGTVDFIPNYDGPMEESKLLPARLPFVLLNGASGIAVGIATEIPSHNLREVAAATVAFIRDGKLTSTDLMQYMPGPDFPGGGQIISSAADIAQVHGSGRGSPKVRACQKIEGLARSQWQLITNELPPNISSQKVLEEIEELMNPKVRTGKKSLLPDQLTMKQIMLGPFDVVHDGSGKDAPVRLVFEPKSKNADQQESANALFAHTSLGSGAAINLVMIGMDGRPRQKGPAEILREWITYRLATVARCMRYRLGKVGDRIHILEGWQLVLLRVEDAIRIIRESEEPKAVLIQASSLNNRQAEDILEIRLCQLARLEAIKTEQELKNLCEEQGELDVLLRSETMMRRCTIKEIETDAKQYGDDHRTFIQEERRAAAEVKVVDEPVTVTVSWEGWIRTHQSHGHDTTQFTLKVGDTLYDTFERRITDALLIFGTRDDKGTGRVYSVAVANLPGGRGDGVPLTTLIELAPDTHVARTFTGHVEQSLVISTRGGNGFLAKVDDMAGRQKAGKVFLTLDEDDQPDKPAPVSADAYGVACLSEGGRLLLFQISKLKTLASGGRGVILIELGKNEALLQAVAFDVTGFVLSNTGPHGGKAVEQTMTTRAQEPYAGKRTYKGKTLGPKLRDPKLSLPKPASDAA